MNKWEMPKVAIEKFTANEYLSACGEPPEMEPYRNNYWYADLDNPDLGYDSIDYDGPGDGKWNNGVTEQAYYNNSPTMDHLPHWFTKKNVYVDGPSGARYGAEFSDTSYFKKVGTYDIYMTKTRVYFYPAGMGGGFTPPGEKNHS